jgi:hypothetical protein
MKWGACKAGSDDDDDSGSEGTTYYVKISG